MVSECNRSAGRYGNDEAINHGTECGRLRVDRRWPELCSAPGPAAILQSEDPLCWHMRD